MATLFSSLCVLLLPHLVVSTVLDCWSPSTFEYFGTRDVASGNRPCINWNELRGRDPLMVGKVFAMESFDNPGRYCRNANEDPQGPWCYVDRDLTRAYCDIPECPGEKAAKPRPLILAAEPQRVKRSFYPPAGCDVMGNCGASGDGAEGSGTEGSGWEGSGEEGCGEEGSGEEGFGEEGSAEGWNDYGEEGSGPDGEGSAEGSGFRRRRASFPTRFSSLPVVPANTSLVCQSTERDSLSCLWRSAGEDKMTFAIPKELVNDILYRKTEKRPVSWTGSFYYLYESFCQIVTRIIRAIFRTAEPLPEEVKVIKCHFTSKTCLITFDDSNQKNRKKEVRMSNPQAVYLFLDKLHVLRQHSPESEELLVKKLISESFGTL